MEQKELFNKTVQAAEKLNKAINLAFPGYIIDELDANLAKLWTEIESRGLVEAFAEYAL